MRYVDTGIQITPKHCKYGPRPAEGLVFNPYEWWSITDHLIKDQREKEIAAVQKAKEEAKKEISFNMTRNWNNTLASIKTLGDQRKIEKMEKEKQEKIDKYNEIMRSRKEEKAEVLAQARKILYENKDTSKAIKSALLFSTVLKEREKQVEFKKALKQESAKKEFEFAEKYRKDAEEFNREKLQEKINEKLKKKTQKADLDKQMSEIRLKKQAEAEEVELEKKDLINMRIEAERIKNCNLIEKNHRKEIAGRCCQKSQNQIEFERKLVLEQEEEDEINKIYMAYDKRFRDGKKEREIKAREEANERQKKAAENIIRIRAESEETKYDRSDAEVEAEAIRKEEEEKRTKKERRDELIQAKKQVDEMFEKKKQERKEEMKWEIMQIYRTMEINEEWKNSERKKMKESKAATRAAYDEQCRELEERRKEELREREAPLENVEKEKEDVLRYCDDAMDYVAKHNLPSYPVLKRIDKIKKDYGIPTEKDTKSQIEPQRPKQGPLGSGCYCLKY